MAVFYINLKGSSIDGADFVGHDFANSEAARAAAIQAGRALLADEMASGKLPLDEWIEVEDADHRPLMRLPLARITP